MNICAVITIIAELVFVFINDYNDGKEKLLWVCTALNILTLFCFTVSKAAPLSTRQFFIDLKNIFTCCCIKDADIYRVRMSEAYSYDRIVKILLTIVAILFLIIVPSGIHWQSIEPKIRLHRYIYVAVLMGGYFAWNMLYIMEASYSLKHPLGNCTRI